jgi:hypothetical protein
LVNILILRLCNYDKSPDHVESAGKFTLNELKSGKRLYSLEAEDEDVTYDDDKNQHLTKFLSQVTLSPDDGLVSYTNNASGLTGDVLVKRDWQMDDVPANRTKVYILTAADGSRFFLFFAFSKDGSHVTLTPTGTWVDDFSASITSAANHSGSNQQPDNNAQPNSKTQPADEDEFDGDSGKSTLQAVAIVSSVAVAVLLTAGCISLVLTKRQGGQQEALPPGQQVAVEAGEVGQKRPSRVGQPSEPEPSESDVDALSSMSELSTTDMESSVAIGQQQP